MKIKRFLSLLLLLTLLMSTLCLPILAEEGDADTDAASDTGSYEVKAKAAILLDMNTGRTIYEKNIDERVYPASLTKIMTCLLALENGNLSDIVTSRQTTSHAVSPPLKCTFAFPSRQTLPSGRCGCALLKFCAYPSHISLFWASCSACRAGGVV